MIGTAWASLTQDKSLIAKMPSGWATGPLHSRQARRTALLKC